MEWISVETQPNKDRAILLRFEDSTVETGYLCLETEVYKSSDDWVYLEDPLWWMPLDALPEPPK